LVDVFISFLLGNEFFKKNEAGLKSSFMGQRFVYLFSFCCAAQRVLLVNLFSKSAPVIIELQKHLATSKKTIDNAN